MQGRQTRFGSWRQKKQKKRVRDNSQPSCYGLELPAYSRQTFPRASSLPPLPLLFQSPSPSSFTSTIQNTPVIYKRGHSYEFLSIASSYFRPISASIPSDTRQRVKLSCSLLSCSLESLLPVCRHAKSRFLLSHLCQKSSPSPPPRPPPR